MKKFNLVENYKKLFGDFKTSDNLGVAKRRNKNTNTLSESEQKRWVQINNLFKLQCPGHDLSLTENFITLDKVVIDNKKDFFNKTNEKIMTILHHKARR